MDENDAVLTAAQETMAWLHAIVCGLVDQEKQVFISVYVTDMGVLFKVKVSPADIGKTIGKEGRMARALRTLLMTRGRKDRTRYSLDIEERTGGDVEAPLDAVGVLVTGRAL